MPANSLTLQDLVRLDRQLRRDQDRSLRELQARDRHIGATLSSDTRSSTSPKHCLKTWLDATDDPTDGALAGIGLSVGFWMGLLGLVLGLFAMGGFLLVDRSQPVNVLLFLVVFVGSQWLLLLLTLLLVLAVAIGFAPHLPLEGLNPARWMLARYLRRFAPDLRSDQFSPVLRLALLGWGQLFGVMFNLGVLATLLLILLVVDRSFGWSSTLNLSPGGLHDLVQWLSLPWSRWLPEASVSREVIEVTRYQSLQTLFSPKQVTAMRQWWPFLFACISFYGLLPRLLLWVVFYAGYRRQLSNTFINYPGARLVLQRMTSPIVHTRGEQREQPLAAGKAAVPHQSLPRNGTFTLVNWSGALGPQSRSLLSELGLDTDNMETAGLALKDDQALLSRINQQQQDLVILVKSWEPPLSELGDFLSAINVKRDCYLLLLPLENRGIKAEALADWQQFAAQQHHPRLVLAPARMEAAP